MVCLERLVPLRLATLSYADGRKIVPGGPQPRNTLSRSTFATGSGINGKTAPNPRGETQHALAVELHKGSNVHSVSNAYESDEFLPTPPSAKRRKLDRQASPASSDQTDPLDQISPHAISFHTSQDISHHPSRAPSASAISQASNHPLKRNGSFEYRKIERMMDSNPKPKKQRHSENRNYAANHTLLPLSPQKRSSMSNPIDISGDESQPTKAKSQAASHSSYRGTARQPPPTSNGIKSNTSETFKERAKLTQSPYFDKARPNTNRANGNVKQTIGTLTLSKESSPGLAKKFVAADGRRRGSDVNVSSDADELQSAPTTVGQNADPDAVFTVKEMRSNSPSKQSSMTLKASTPTDNLAIWPPSTVKSDFVGSNARSRSSGRPTRPVPNEQEAKPPWSVPLAAISFPGELFKNDDLGLVYDPKQEEYYIQMQGSPIKIGNNSLRIRPQKTVKVLWEMSGKKIRLESSRSGIEDNVLDLELALERDILILLENLQTSNSFQVIGKSRYVFGHSNEVSRTKANAFKNSEYMQKIFDKRRSEVRHQYGSTKSNKPEEIERITDSRQRKDPSKSLDFLDAGKVSRKREKHSIVDELVRSATHDTDMGGSKPKAPMPAMPNGLPQKSGITEILAKLKPAHNEHLNPRRSTRSSTVHEGESLLSSLDGVPKKEKYSEKHGLGDPWKKPLTYPKVGKKKTTVEWSDLERLDEGEFLNDNLISFYLRYLEQRLEDERPGLANRIYFFNTFFFATLTSAHKGRKRFNYEGVQKWTRSVDLFTYDYIVVPINEQAHWYLAIICNLPALDRDLAMPEESASSPIEEDGAASKAEPASNATNQPDGNEFETPRPIATEPNERETRNSFSQLSLENNVPSPARDDVGFHESKVPERPRPASEDKEMLDSQIEDTMPEFTASKEAENGPSPAKEQVHEVVNPVEDQDESPKAAAKSRKSKRKSLPAPITKVDPRKPAIITFDSLGQPRGQTIRILKDYLREEAKAKRGMEFEDSQIKGINAKRIPQQDNFSDCGVFLLGYVDIFLSLETDPKVFITKTIQQTHEEKDWSKLVPGNLRASIRNQVQELHKVQTDERREESAKKSGKTAQRDDRKLEPSPLHASEPVKTVQKKLGEAIGADSVQAVTEKAPEPSLLDMPQTNDETLEDTRCREEDDIRKRGDALEEDALEELLQRNERDMEKSAEYQRLFNSDDAKYAMNDEGAPSIPPDDPSVIMVDNQSQRMASAPSGVVNPSASSNHQKYPKSTSSSIVNPQPFSVDEQKSPDLPSEIPDSQNSATSQTIAKIPDESEKAAPAAYYTVISDKYRERPDQQGEGSERSKRRKTGRGDRVDVQEGSEKHDMIFTIEKPSERREEHKEPSKRRKRSGKEAARDFEEVLVHVIDD